MMTAQNFTNADLTGAASIAEVQQRLRDFIEKRGVTAEGVVQGNGYDHNAFVEGRHPSRQELDEVSRKIPIIVNHASGHVGAANTRALELAGVDASFADPDGGKDVYKRQELARAQPVHELCGEERRHDRAAADDDGDEALRGDGRGKFDVHDGPCGA